MSDRFERKVIHTRKFGGRSVRQTGQFAAVALGQMPLGRANLLFDQVEVVEQPFRGRRDPTVRRHRRSQQITNFYEDAFVLAQPCQQVVGAARCQPVNERKFLSVLLQLVGAEQLGS